MARSNVILGQSSGQGEVKVFSVGSALQGGPVEELNSPVEHGDDRGFQAFAALLGRWGPPVAFESWSGRAAQFDDDPSTVIDVVASDTGRSFKILPTRLPPTS